jgi:hypothetical protein
MVDSDVLPHTRAYLLGQGDNEAAAREILALGDSVNAFHIESSANASQAELDRALALEGRVLELLKARLGIDRPRPPLDAA